MTKKRKREDLPLTFDQMKVIRRMDLVETALPHLGRALVLLVGFGGAALCLWAVAGKSTELTVSVSFAVTLAGVAAVIAALRSRSGKTDERAAEMKRLRKRQNELEREVESQQGVIADLEAQLQAERLSIEEPGDRLE